MQVQKESIRNAILSDLSKLKEIIQQEINGGEFDDVASLSTDINVLIGVETHIKNLTKT